jgi:hypothetical protein
MTGIEKGVNAFLAGLIGIAVVTVLVSQKSQTSSVLNSAGGALSGSLSAAQGNPVG